MLAHTYEPDSTKKKKNNIIFPCYAQPKLDGLRCITYLDKTGIIRNQSRTGSFFEFLEHIRKDLVLFFEEHPTIVLDGELYTDEMPFEELAGIIKKKSLSNKDREQLHKVKYHVYDLFDTSSPTPFTNRYNKLQTFFESYFSTDNKNIVCVNTVSVDTLVDFRRLFSEFVEEGYEGIIFDNFLI